MKKQPLDKSRKEVKGSLKEALGKVTGDESLEARGAGEKGSAAVPGEPEPEPAPAPAATRDTKKK